MFDRMRPGFGGRNENARSFPVPFMALNSGRRQGSMKRESMWHTVILPGPRLLSLIDHSSVTTDKSNIIMSNVAVNNCHTSC